jgi:SAM-dependent methyltransferase
LSPSRGVEEVAMVELVHEEQETKLHREVMERLWTEPLLKQVASRLSAPASCSVLVAEARCGLVPVTWAASLPEDTRVIALDPSRAMLDVARQRVEADRLQRRVFLVSQRVGAISYADDVFKASVCLNGVNTASQARDGLKELARVTQAGGQVIFCAPLADSFYQFHDLFEEALREHQLEEPISKLAALPAGFISMPTLLAHARELGLQQIELERVSWKVSFDSGRSFLMSPLLRETFFSHWIGVVRSIERERVLRAVADLVDTYYHDRAFRCDVSAVCLVARR